MRIFIFSILLPFFLNSQTLNDAIAWSFENESGNSRYMSMGGAFGALGGNLSAISTNPASGAVFELSRAGASLIVNNNSTKSIFFGNENTLKSNNSNYQLGLIYVFKNYGDGNLNKFSVGFNYQSQNNFYEEFKVSGRTNNSIDSFFINNSIGVNINDISVNSNESVRGVYKWLGENLGYYAQQAFLGYQSYILDYSSDSNSFYSLAKYENGLDINNFLFSTGNNNLTSLNLSWQFKGNFYWGININFHEVFNEKELRHIESNFDADSPITDIDFRNYLTTNGNGISFQGGLIYKAGSIRFGISYNSPTYYSFEDNLEQYIKTSSIDSDGIVYTDIVEPMVSNIYQYNFRSPSKLTFSGASVINNMFLLSFDLISKNYSNSLFKSDFSGVYSDLNNTLKNDLSKVIDYKIGTEFKINNVSLRAGFKSLSNPYKNGNKTYVESSSLGFGFNFNKSSIDLAISSSKLNYDYQLFDTGLIDKALINDKQMNIIFSYNIIF